VSFATLQETEKHDSLIRHRLRYERESFKSECIEQDAGITFENLTYLYLKFKQFDKKKLSDFVTQAKFALETHGNTPVAEIDTAVLCDMIGKLMETGIKQNTVRRRFASIKAVLNCGFKNGYLEKIPSMPEIAGCRDEKFVPPTPEELAAIYQVAPPHLQRVIILGYYAGMRVGPSEMFRLRWTDVDLSARVIRVPNADKGNADPCRDVPINDNIYAMLAEWKREDEMRR
jgi:integrase